MGYSNIGLQLEQSNTELQRKLKVAVMKAAQDVRAEDAGTANHTQRLLWATASLAASVRQSLQNMADLMIADLLANATVAAAGDAAVDSDVQFVVNSLIGSSASLTRYLP